MPAPTLAAALTGVQSGSAMTLVNGVRYITNPPGPTFLPGLDSSLSTLRFPPQPSTLAPSGSKPPPSNLGTSLDDQTEPSSSSLAPAPGPKPPVASPSPLQRGDLIAIQSPPHTGKTKLALFLVMVTILPGSVELEEAVLGSGSGEGIAGGVGTSSWFSEKHSLAGVRNSGGSRGAGDRRWKVKDVWIGSGPTNKHDVGSSALPSASGTAKEGQPSSGASSAQQHPRIALGGKAQSCVFVHPASHRSPLPSLIRSIKSHIRDRLLSFHPSTFATGMSSISHGLSKSDVDALVEEFTQESLGRLTMVVLPPGQGIDGREAPYAILCAALMHLSGFARGLRGGELGMVVVDGFGDAFWLDRWRTEKVKEEAAAKKEAEDEGQTKLPAVGKGKAKEEVPPPEIRGSESVGMEDVMNAVTTLRRETGCVVVLTTQGLFRERQDRSSRRAEAGADGTSTLDDLFWTEHLPAPFPSPFAPPPATNSNSSSSSNWGHWPLTAHITLLPAHTTLRPFRPEITLEDALGEQGEKREKARSAAKVRGLLRVNPMAVMGAPAKPVLGSLGRFEFGVDADGLII